MITQVLETKGGYKFQKQVPPSLRPPPILEGGCVFYSQSVRSATKRLHPFGLVVENDDDVDPELSLRTEVLGEAEAMGGLE